MVCRQCRHHPLHIFLWWNSNLHLCVWTCCGILDFLSVRWRFGCLHVVELRRTFLHVCLTRKTFIISLVASAAATYSAFVVNSDTDHYLFWICSRRLIFWCLCYLRHLSGNNFELSFSYLVINSHCICSAQCRNYTKSRLKSVN